ncbi:MAG: hypothetical protein QG553_848 [Patescibacteria group bacterium]|nr:hypothetical protein [Patescibacteria group bacterium]
MSKRRITREELDAFQQASDQAQRDLFDVMPDIDGAVKVVVDHVDGNLEIVARVSPHMPPADRDNIAYLMGDLGINRLVEQPQPTPGQTTV